ncbi:MAG TPA: archaetidylserine decarboxylase [Longimicrobiales bacterium]
MSVPDVSPEIPPLRWRATLRLLGGLPQGAMSRGFGAIADIPLPRSLRRPVLSAFARATGIDATRAEKDIAEYGSINEFFVRRLRPGAHSIDASSDRPVSPVDGIVGQLGGIEKGSLIQAKGRTYTAGALLGDPLAAERFRHGSFITIYLSPRHYHRIHAPCSGAIRRCDHIPGALLPVNLPSVMHIDALFPRNERLVCYIEDGGGSFGSTAVVAVGAYNVGRISAAFDPAWRDGRHITNRRDAAGESRHYDPPVAVAKGDEIMAFHLGSTVVLLFDRPVTFLPGIAPGSDVTMGSAIGML